MPSGKGRNNAYGSHRTRTNEIRPNPPRWCGRPSAATAPSGHRREGRIPTSRV